jgi:hypothetical protein
MPVPRIPIEVDTDTGHWITDGVPMVYTPRAFFVNIQKAVEDAIGIEGYRERLYEAAYDKRGWGRFSLVEADWEAGTARARLDHSAIAAGFGKSRRRVCYMFDGAFAAAMDRVGEAMGQEFRSTCTELTCAAQEDHDHCVFAVGPR